MSDLGQSLLHSTLCRCFFLKGEAGMTSSVFLRFCSLFSCLFRPYPSWHTCRRIAKSAKLCRISGNKLTKRTQNVCLKRLADIRRPQRAGNAAGHSAVADSAECLINTKHTSCLCFGPRPLFSQSRSHAQPWL